MSVHPAARAQEDRRPAGVEERLAAEQVWLYRLVQFLRQALSSTSVDLARRHERTAGIGAIGSAATISDLITNLRSNPVTFPQGTR